MNQPLILKALTTSLDDFGLGRLKRSKNEEFIEYQPFEVSKLSLGVISAIPLEINETLLLETHVGKAELIVAEDVGSVGETYDHHRYRLAAKDGLTDIERIFIQTGCQRKLALSDKGMQFSRFRDSRVRVRAKTFGSRDRYGLTTINISKSGLLMRAPARDRVPFIVNTLLEIELDAPDILGRPVVALAKVTRAALSGNRGERQCEFGVQFIEFNEEGMEAWKSAINDIEVHAQEKQEK